MSGAKTRETELAARMETLYKSMSIQQRRFVDLVVKHYADIETGKIQRAELYLRAYPKCNSTSMAVKSSSRAMGLSERPGQYVDMWLELNNSKQKRAEKRSIMSIEQLKEFNTRVIEGYDMLFDEILEQRVYTIYDKKSGERTGYETAYFVDDPNDIPKVLLKYVKSMDIIDGEPGVRVTIAEAAAYKDRLKAADMLSKLQGGYVDRKEVALTGAGGGPIKIEGEIKVEVTNVVKKLLDGL